MQCLARPDQNDLVPRAFGGLIAPLEPDDALLEFAYTLEDYRAAGDRCPGPSRSSPRRHASAGAKRLVIWISVDNLAMERYFRRVGFVPFASRRERYRFGRRTVRFGPLERGRKQAGRDAPAPSRLRRRKPERRPPARRPRRAPRRRTSLVLVDRAAHRARRQPARRVAGEVGGVLARRDAEPSRASPPAQVGEVRHRLGQRHGDRDEQQRRARCASDARARGAAGAGRRSTCAGRARPRSRAPPRRARCRAPPSRRGRARTRSR